MHSEEDSVATGSCQVIRINGLQRMKRCLSLDHRRGQVKGLDGAECWEYEPCGQRDSRKVRESGVRQREEPIEL